ncbi:MAG: alanine--tRNA ligase [Patescibacteria group bacterium]|nr:alanine--tRNA ligase [Patescibacteria group bacterium]
MTNFTAQEIRHIFLDFFKQKKHEIVSSSSLIPADPTVLFTSAGMQQFIPYLSSQVVPPYRRAASCQKCFRTSDIDNIGSAFHHTFFEMLGNWSFGDYWKKEAIELALELLNIRFKIPKSKLWVTVFGGEDGVAEKDKEAIRFWREVGIPRERIKEFGMTENFWGPIGVEGPCGPCSEIHYDRGEEFREKECSLPNCGPNCACGRFVEIWNLVFMEYFRTKEGHYKKLPRKNIDTGAGLERLTCVLQNKKSNFETDLFLPLIKKIEEISEIPYRLGERFYRIVADHLRAVCFLISEGLLPSKEERGYILRRILRRAIRYGNLIKTKKGFLIPLANLVIENYHNIYPELSQKRNDILTVIQQEEEKFGKTLEKGIKELQKIIGWLEKEKSSMIGEYKPGKLLDKKKIYDPIKTYNELGEKFFYIYETYGFPLELSIEEIEKIHRETLPFKDEIKEGFEMSFQKHQEISRAGAKKKFGGHGLGGDVSNEEKEKIVQLHTATHLLHATLRQVLGNHVQQAGSDINSERLRFDFTYPRKLSETEIKKIEEIVNQKIKENLEVKFQEMSYEEAIQSGALAFFKERYPKIVKVYSIGNFSKEICAGPHVRNTSELGRFKIIKEEASTAGTRRVKAILIKN